MLSGKSILSTVKCYREYYYYYAQEELGELEREGRHGRNGETKTEAETNIRSEMTQGGAVAMEMAALDLLATG